MGTRRIAVVTGTRAEYGMLTPVLHAIRRHPALELQLIVTGMHLMRDFGYTVAEIERDGFPIAARVEMPLESDQPSAVARSVGAGVAGMADALDELVPAIVLLLGDRGEPLAAAIAATYLTLPIAHLHGGEVTGGSIDDNVRNAISKLAHVHFVATAEAAARLRQLGEAEWRVHVVGSPSIDAIMAMDVPPREELARRLRLSPAERWIVVLQHPETLGGADSGAQMRAILGAVTDVGGEIVAIYPNSDPGSAKIIDAIQEGERRNPRLRSFRSLAYPDYLALLRHAALLVGNSSSGLREAASFGLPFVNVGMRQSGRGRGENVIDTASDRASIAHGIARALTDRTFRERALAGHNPYGDGKSAERIVALLADVALDPRLLRKAPIGQAEP